MRRALAVNLALLASLTLAGLASPAGAQSNDGTLYLTATEVDVDGFLDCVSTKGYEMSPAVETPDESEKAYVSSSYGVSSCPTTFQYELPADVALKGEATLTIFFGCEAPTPFQPEVTVPELGTIGQMSASLQKNGEEIGWTQASPFGATCTAGDVKEGTLTYEELDTQLSKGDSLSIELRIYGLSPEASEAPNLHVLTGSEEHPSGLTSAAFAPPSTTDDDQAADDGDDAASDGSANETQTEDDGTEDGNQTSSGNQTASGNETSDDGHDHEHGGHDHAANESDEPLNQTTVGSSDEGNEAPGFGIVAALVAVSIAVAVQRHRTRTP